MIATKIALQETIHDKFIVIKRDEDEQLDDLTQADANLPTSSMLPGIQMDGFDLIDFVRIHD